MHILIPTLHAIDRGAEEYRGGQLSMLVRADDAAVPLRNSADAARRRSVRVERRGAALRVPAALALPSDRRRDALRLPRPLSLEPDSAGRGRQWTRYAAG